VNRRARTSRAAGQPRLDVKETFNRIANKENVVSKNDSDEVRLGAAPVVMTLQEAVSAIGPEEKPSLPDIDSRLRKLAQLLSSPDARIAECADEIARLAASARWSEFFESAPPEWKAVYEECDRRDPRMIGPGDIARLRALLAESRPGEGQGEVCVPAWGIRATSGPAVAFETIVADASPAAESKSRPNRNENPSPPDLAGRLRKIAQAPSSPDADPSRAGLQSEATLTTNGVDETDRLTAAARWAALLDRCAALEEKDRKREVAVPAKGAGAVLASRQRWIAGRCGFLVTCGLVRDTWDLLLDAGTPIVRGALADRMVAVLEGLGATIDPDMPGVPWGKQPATAVTLEAFRETCATMADTEYRSAKKRKKGGNAARKAAKRIREYDVVAWLSRWEASWMAR
jgi:hypothetical protein